MVQPILPPASGDRCPRRLLRAECLRRKCRAGGTLSARLDATSHGLLIVGLRAARPAPSNAATRRTHAQGSSCRATYRIALATLGLEGNASRDALEALLAASLAAA